MMPAPVGVVTNWIDMNRMNSDRHISRDSNLANEPSNALCVMRNEIEEVLCDVEKIILNEYEYGLDTNRLFDQAITEVNSIVDDFSQIADNISNSKVNLSPTVQ